MNQSKAVLTITLFILSFSALASPYDSLTFALRQQKIIDDLRSHCQIDKTISDEKIKSTFLHDKQTESQIVAVAAALRNKDNETYSEAIEDIQCPEIH